MKDAVQQALSQKGACAPPPSTPGVARRVMKEQKQQLAREKQRLQQAVLAQKRLEADREKLQQQQQQRQRQQRPRRSSKDKQDDKQGEDNTFEDKAQEVKAKPVVKAGAREGASRVARVAEAPALGGRDVHRARDAAVAEQQQVAAGSSSR